MVFPRLAPTSCALLHLEGSHEEGAGIVWCHGGGDVVLAVLTQFLKSKIMSHSMHFKHSTVTHYNLRQSSKISYHVGILFFEVILSILPKT